MEQTVSYGYKSHQEKLFLRSTVMTATCLMLVFTMLLAGCSGIHSSAKQVSDSAPPNEAQKMKRRDDVSFYWPVRIFLETVNLLSKLMPGPEEQEEALRQTRAQLREELNRQRREEAAGKKQR